jgi:hypothetical protein
MRKIYQRIWKLAKPYYQKGRPMDIDHIEWMLSKAELVCEKEKLDHSLLIPLVILHDVGYAVTPKGNPYDPKLRRAHMKAGAVIAKKILGEVDYPKDKTNQIVHYVSVHDNWALGNNQIYNEDKILGVFSDLDYTWMATTRGFPALMKILKFNSQQMFDFLINNKKLINLPFCTKTTKQLYHYYLEDRRKDLLKTGDLAL